MKLTDTVPALRYGGKDLEFPRFPVRFERHTTAAMQEPPTLGEHSEQILRDLLGYSEAEINDLRQ